ncbi:hypothetical protein COBT_000753 [Conglomerata obtusa]
MTLEWNNFNIEVINRNKKYKKKYIDLVKNSSGYVKHGEILAIMGPSGGGKTTLLNALAGRIPCGSITQGSILYNNKFRCKNEWFNMIGVVDQDDIVHEDLSIEETLTYAAEFRLKSNKDKIKTIVSKLLKALKLENVSENEMRKVSGGERKRVMIGVELVTDPDIIFLDEPTSGLDTLTALKICKILKNLAEEEKKIIILTIHQPSQEIFYLFDRLILLSEGNTIYNGLISESEKYFADKKMEKRIQTTFPEFIVEICSEDYKLDNPEIFYCEESIFKDKPVEKNLKTRKKKNDFYLKYNPNLKHVFILLKRKFNVLKHQKMKFVKAQASKLIAYFFLLFIEFYLYKILDDKTFYMQQQNVPLVIINNTRQNLELVTKKQFLSFGLFLTIFSQLSSVIPSFYDEIRLVMREIAVGSYSTGSYFVSLLFYNVLIELFTPIIVFILSWILIENTDEYKFCAYVLTAFFTVPFGLMIGSISCTKQFVLILTSVFSGLAALTPSLIYLINSKIGTDNNGNRNQLSLLTYLAVFVTPIFYSALVIYNFSKANYPKVASVNIDDIKKSFDSELIACLKYIDMRDMSELMLLVFTLLSPFACIFIGIALLGINLMPNVRMKLEKNTVNKSM